MKSLWVALLVGMVLAGSVAMADDTVVIFQIRTPRIEPNQNLPWGGVGFFLDGNHMLTCKHVVMIKDRDPSRPIAVTVRGKQVRAEMIAISEKFDLALLYVKGAGEKSLKLCSNHIRRDEVYTHTLDGYDTLTKYGTIKKMIKRGENEGEFISSTKGIHGNSGSPTLKNGCVVGVMYAIDKDKKGRDQSWHIGTQNIRAFIYKWMTPLEGGKRGI